MQHRLVWLFDLFFACPGRLIVHEPRGHPRTGVPHDTAAMAGCLKRRFIPAVTVAVAVVVAVPATGSAAEGKGSPDAERRQRTASAEVLANEILNRWEPVALSAGM